MNSISKKFKNLSLATLILLVSHGVVFAQETAAAGKEIASQTSNTAFPSIVLYILVGVIVLFAVILFALSSAIKTASKGYQERIRKESGLGKKILSIFVVLTLLSNSLFAQELPVKGTNFASNWDVYLILFTVFILFIAILVLVRCLFILMGVNKVEIAEPEANTISKWTIWFQKFNGTVSIEQEAELDLSHDYDGIRELDNKIPSWWSWAFFSFVFVAIVYLYRMFVSETLPNQFVELEKANEMAEIQKAEYLKKGANNVDETNVVLLGSGDIAEGAGLYAKNCIACHGDKGQGGVGPNLTDDYWIHKGGITDIFYSIKYGWQEKGMKSWKDDFSPIQIAQISSFVKNLKGTNPPAAKEKQGELYSEEGASPSNANPIDSSKSITTTH